MNARLLKTLLGLATLVIALSATPAIPSAAQQPPLTSVLARGGFGDAENTQAWSMAWFNGELYVGTGRAEPCVTLATVDFYFPDLHYYDLQPIPDAQCPPDKYDLDLRAEIWRFTPTTGIWTRVYRSPREIPNPRAPGKFVSRDIGYRGMVVYEEPGQPPALYVGGITAGEYIPELAEANPPRILRSTDGENFTPIEGAPPVLDTAFGRQRPIGYRAMVVHDKRLFVSASGGLQGDGVILEVGNPSGAQPTFTQVSPNTMSVFELEEFNGHLYVGAADLEDGYSVWRTDVTGSPGDFISVVTGGAGRGSEMVAVLSMHVYKGRLYVGSNGGRSSPSGGSSGGSSSLFPPSELIRINRDDTWELVAGKARITPERGLVFPISGLSDGFGNAFNGHLWRQQAHEGGLYVGTFDWSVGLRGVPLLDGLLRPEFGFDIYGTCDGQFWWIVTRDAFGGNASDFGARTMASTPAGAFIGSVNHAEGASVWRSNDPSPCGASGSTARAGDAHQAAPTTRQVIPTPSTLPPGRLLTDARRCGTVLSWDQSDGASRYRILRAPSRLVRDVYVWQPPALPNGYRPELPPVAANPNEPGSTRVDIPITGAFASIGTTSKAFFADRSARRGARYVYQVTAEAPSGAASAPSNAAIVPSERPAATFDEVRGLLRETAARARRLGESGSANMLRAFESAASASWQRADRARRLASLRRLHNVAGDAARGTRLRGSAVTRELLDAAFRLDRRIRVAVACRP